MGNILDNSSDAYEQGGVGGGTVTNGANVGTGIGVFKALNGTVLEFKTLIVGTGIAITLTGLDEITVANTGGTIASIASNPVNLFQITNASGPNTTIGSNNLINLTNSALVEGCDVTVNAGAPTTSVDIALGTGRFTNNTTNPNSPTYANIAITAKTAVLLTNLATAGATLLFINSSNAVVQVIDSSISSNYRNFVFIGTVFHPNGVIDSISQTCLDAINIKGDLIDFFQGVGSINTSGNLFTANGANLLLNKSAGTSFTLGGNYKADKANPNKLTQGALTGLTFRYAFRNGTGGVTFTATTTTVNPNNFDNGTGVLGVVPANRWTNQRIYLVPSTNQVVIAYGQNTYANASDALAGLNTETFVPLAGFSAIMLRSALTVNQPATVLNVATSAVFTPATKFGDLGAGGGSSGTALLTDGLPKWAYDATSTANSLPTTGTFKLNTASFATATSMYISYNANNGANLKNSLLGLIAGSQLYLPLQNSTANYALYNVGVGLIDTGTYIVIPITLVGTVGTFANTNVFEFNMLLLKSGGGSSVTLSPVITPYNKDLGQNNFNLAGMVGSQFIAQYTGNTFDFTFFNMLSNGGNYPCSICLYETANPLADTQVYSKIYQSGAKSMITAGYINDVASIPMVAGRGYFCMLERASAGGTITPQCLTLQPANNNAGSNINSTDQGAVAPASFTITISTNTVAGLTAGTAHGICTWFQIRMA